MSKKMKPKKSQVDGKRGSQAEVGVRGSLWRFDPCELTIVGHDTDELDHELCDHESNAFDAEHYEEYIAYMRLNGIDKPIIFRRDGDRVLVIEGRTTTRVARIVAPLWEQDRKAEGLKGDDCKLRVPGVVRRGTADEMFCVSRAANRRRPGSDSSIVDAKAIARLVNNGATEEQASVRLGIPPSRGKRLLAVLQLDPRLQRRVGVDISLEAAAPLAKLPQSEQVAKLAQLGGEVTARAVKNKLRADAGKAPAETAAQKLKRITALIDSFESDLLHMNPEDIDEAHTKSFCCLTKIREVVRAARSGGQVTKISQGSPQQMIARNGVPFASNDAAANGESTEFGA